MDEVPIKKNVKFLRCINFNSISFTYMSSFVKIHHKVPKIVIWDILYHMLRTSVLFWKKRLDFFRSFYVYVLAHSSFEMFLKLNTALNRHQHTDVSKFRFPELNLRRFHVALFELSLILRTVTVSCAFSLNIWCTDLCIWFYFFVEYMWKEWRYLTISM